MVTGDGKGLAGRQADNNQMEEGAREGPGGTWMKPGGFMAAHGGADGGRSHGG